MDVEIGVNGDRGDVRMWNRIIDRTTETKWDLLISSRTQNSNDVCISPGIQGNGRLLNIWAVILILFLTEEDSVDLMLS